jgi:hypothetical protein
MHDECSFTMPLEGVISGGQGATGEGWPLSSSERHGRFDHGSLARCRAHIGLAAEQARPLGHAEQTEERRRYSAAQSPVAAEPASP